MNAAVAGRYFLPGSARFVSASATLGANASLRFQGDDGALIAETPLKQVRISARLGRVPRRFDLPDGSCFETDDNDAADLFATGRAKYGSLLHRLESSWRWIASSIVLAVLAIYLFVLYGIPAAALWLAQETPSSVNGIIAQQSLKVLDGTLLSGSELTPEESAKAQALFARVTALGGRGPGAYTLLLRGSEKIGPNALALPDGTVIMTDELWRMVESDDEIEGVFAHEMAHVDRSHTLQGLYQAALVPAAIAVITGDISQISQIATILPGILVQSAYSRGLEQQADDDGVVTLKRLGGDPAKLAGLLERMDEKLCKKTTCPPSWLGTHPDTAERALRLRRAAGTTGSPL